MSICNIVCSAAPGQSWQVVLDEADDEMTLAATVAFRTVEPDAAGCGLKMLQHLQNLGADASNLSIRM